MSIEICTRCTRAVDTDKDIDGVYSDDKYICFNCATEEELYVDIMEMVKTLELNNNFADSIELNEMGI